VTLSTSEAGYAAMLEAFREIRFISYLLRDMSIPVKLSIMVRTDNTGEMFMGENPSSGVRTRRIDIRYHFIREHVEDGFIKIVFVKTDEMDSGLFTKNVNEDSYERHVVKVFWKIDGRIGVIGRVLECNPCIQPSRLVIL
jgi:hypothetical protein